MSTPSIGGAALVVSLVLAIAVVAPSVFASPPQTDEEDRALGPMSGDPVPPGAFGAVASASTAAVIDTVSDLLGLPREYDREPWERTYMYVVSSLGSLLVAGRVLLHWRIDVSSRGFVPRADSRDHADDGSGESGVRGTSSESNAPGARDAVVRDGSEGHQTAGRDVVP